MIFTALFNNILFFKPGISSFFLLFLPTMLLALAEVFITVGSLCLFYQESPRRAQAVMISIFFLCRYCGSLLFYTVLPIFSSLCKLENPTNPIPHYEYGVLLLLVVALIFNWVEIAIVMAIAALLQAYVVCLWLNRKRHPHTHFRRKATEKEP